MKLEDLVLDDSLGIYVPHDADLSIPYEDGGERYLEDVLRQSEDLSLRSVQLRKAINNWTSLYHFSAYRPTILDCFDYNSTDARVLELGAGCGGVTRWLGENFSEVVAIEGSTKRASIAKLRCRDLRSVKVCGINIFDLEIENSFDIVTLIGVLEYSHLFYPDGAVTAQEAALSLLRFAFNSLNSGGILILAIENKMGLKYLNGAGEDHSGKIFDGIHGYPYSKSAVTYSALELESLIKGAGFAQIDFYLPFPDYKLATTILNWNNLDLQYYMHNWIETPFPDRTRTQRTILFNESLAIREILKAGLLKDLANSFLLVAHKTKPSSQKKTVISRDQNWVARRYSLDRHPSFWKRTSMLLDSENRPKIFNEPAMSSADNSAPQNRLFYHSFTGEKYHNGDLLVFKIFEMLEAGHFDREFLHLLVQYNNFIISQFGSHGESAEEGIPLLSGKALDANFFNIIVNEKTGEWHFIDREWSCSRTIPADFILARNLVVLAQRYHAYLLRHINEKSLEEFVHKWVKRIYPGFNLVRLKMILQIEDAFQNYVNFLSEISEENLNLLKDSGGLNKHQNKPLKLDPDTTQGLSSDVSRRNHNNSAQDNPLVSIVIPVYNCLQYTKNCLIALSENTVYEPYEVIIVDNGSTDGTADFLKCLEGDVKIISNRQNLGFSKACNQGAREASGEYLVFLNNDTIPTTGWLQQLVKTARTDQTIGIIGSKLLYPDNTIQHAGVVFSKYCQVYHIYRGLPENHPSVNRVREFQAVTAACMLIRKDLFHSLGGFDEKYLNGFEDIDLCFKVREKGYKIQYCPQSVVYHFESKTEGRKDHDLQNSHIFSNRWASKIIPDDEKIAEEDGWKIIYDDRKKKSHFVYSIRVIKELQEAGKYDIALNALEQAKSTFKVCNRTQDEEYALVLKELCLEYIRAGKLDDAKKVLLEVFTMKKTILETRDIKQVLSEYLKHQPLDFDVLQKYGEICYQDQDFEMALDTVEKILLFNPKSADVVQLKEKILREWAS